MSLDFPFVRLKNRKKIKMNRKKEKKKNEKNGSALFVP